MLCSRCATVLLVKCDLTLRERVHEPVKSAWTLVSEDLEPAGVRVSQSADTHPINVESRGTPPVYQTALCGMLVRRSQRCDPLLVGCVPGGSDNRGCHSGTGGNNGDNHRYKYCLPPVAPLHLAIVQFYREVHQIVGDLGAQRRGLCLGAIVFLYSRQYELRYERHRFVLPGIALRIEDSKKFRMFSPQLGPAFRGPRFPRELFSQCFVGPPCRGIVGKDLDQGQHIGESPGCEVNIAESVSVLRVSPR
jgi:hypothetical protein